MKNTIPFLALLLFLIGCGSEPSSSGQEKPHFTFQVDTSIWKKHDTAPYADYLTSLTNLPPGMADVSISHLYTASEEPGITHPFFAIMESKTSTPPPPMDILEGQLGALAISANDLKKLTTLGDLITEFEFEGPYLIKEMRLMITRGRATDILENEIIVEQAIFFQGEKLTVLQLAYLDGQDEKYLQSFKQVVETMKF